MVDWHRRRDLRLGRFFDMYIFVGLFWALILTICVVFVYFLAFLSQKDQYSNLHQLQMTYLSYADISIDENGKIINAGDKMVRSKRLAALEELRDSAKIAKSDVFKKLSDYGERIEEGIKAGQVSLVYVPTWGDFFKDLYTWGLAGFGLLLGTTIFLSFALYSYIYAYPSYCLLDLPWQKPWTWVFAALTIPINIPFFAVSAIRILLASRNNIGPEANQNQLPKTKRNTSVRWIKPRNTNVKAISFKEYLSSKKAWVEIYASKCRGKWLGQLELCRKKIAEQRRSLTDYGDIIIRTQENLAKAQQELRNAEAAEPNFYSDAIKAAQIEDEFDRLLNLPAIARIEVTGQAIEVWTHPAIIYIDSQPHDFGSYRITVAVNGDLGNVDVRAVFSTKFKGDGHLYGGDRNGNFCFGTRRDTINSLLLRGEYLPAFILMLEGIHHVNPDSEEQAARLYPGVRNA